MKTILMLNDSAENANLTAKATAKILPPLKADVLIYTTCYEHAIPPTYTRASWVAAINHLTSGRDIN